MKQHERDASIKYRNNYRVDAGRAEEVLKVFVFAFFCFPQVFVVKILEIPAAGLQPDIMQVPAV